MSQPNPEHKFQKQENIVKDTTVSGDFTFAPQQIETYIETQIVEISAEKVTQKELRKASPYKGLKRFNFGDREYFFGRDALIAKLFNAVNESSFSLVLGASGSGKSSVIRAGLISELKKSLESQKFYDFIFTPNQDPFKSLYRCLLNEEKDYKFTESEAKVALEAKPDTISQLISTLKKEEEKWFLFIDQFEQLFTICTDTEKRKNFIEGIVRVVKKGDNSVRIVLAMRSDFLEQFSFYPSLAKIADQDNIHLVTEMYPDELRQAIEQPAAKHGVVFEKGLVKQIIKEVEGQKGYLPLLQYTLNLLWEKECTTKASDGRFHIEDRTLNKTTYNTLKGVRGALQERVDDMYRDICEKTKDGELATKQIFLKLVNIVESDSGSRPVSRRAYRYEFVGEPVETNLKKFIDENLLVSSYEYSSEYELSVGNSKKSIQHAIIEIAHEILLSSWDKLKRWLEEEKEAIILKNWLAGETRRYLEVRAEDESKASDELLKGSRLDQIVEFREKNAFEKLGGLVQEENEFIDVSIEWQNYLLKKEEERRQRELTQERKARKLAQTRNMILTLSVLVLSGLTIFAFNQQQQKEKQRIEAEKQRITALSSSSELLFNSRQEFEAILQGLEAGINLNKIGAEKEVKIKNKLVTSLESIIYRIREKNFISLKNQQIEDISFSKNSQIIASFSQDNIVRLWNLEGKLIKAIPHENPVKSVVFHPNDNKIIASLSNTVKFWNLEGKLIKEIAIKNNSFDSLNLISDGSMLVLYGNKSIEILRYDGSLISDIKSDKWEINDVKFSPDGKMIAVGYEDATVKLYRLDGTLIKTLESAKHEGILRVRKEPSISFIEGKGVLSVNFSPDGEMIASGNHLGKVTVWDIEGNVIGVLKGLSDDVIKSVSFSPKSSIVIGAGNGGRVYVWQIWRNNSWASDNGKLIKILEGYGEYDLEEVNFSPNGKIIAARVGGIIKLWESYNWTSNERNLILPEVQKVVFSPDNKLIASRAISTRNYAATIRHSDNIGELYWKKGNFGTIGSPNIINIWNHDGNWLTAIEHDDFVLDFVFSPDANTIASVSKDNDKVIKLWNRDGSFLKNIEGHTDTITDISFSPDSKSIVSSSKDKTMKIWNLDGKLIKTIKGDNDIITSVNFKEDGETLVSASGDNTIKFWNLDGKLIRNIETSGKKILSIDFSSDGLDTVVVSNDGSVRLYSPDNELLLTTYPTEEEDNIFVEASFSPDGELIAFNTAHERLLKLYNRDGELLKTITHETGIINFSWSSDGNMIATASFDGTVRLWSRDGNLLKLLEGPRPGMLQGFWSVQFSKHDNTLVLINSVGGGKLWNFDFDNLIVRGCDWVRGYLENNPNVDEEDRSLCDGIDTHRRTKTESVK